MFRLLICLFALSINCIQAEYNIEPLFKQELGIEDAYIVVSAFNNSGMVTGHIEYADVRRAFIYDMQKGQWQFITEELDDDDEFNFVYSINDQNQVLLKLDREFYVWDHGLQKIGIGHQLFQRIRVAEINNLGQVYLSIGDKNFLWDAEHGVSRIHIESLIPITHTAEGCGINDKGQILFDLYVKYEICEEDDDLFECGYCIYENGVLIKIELRHHQFIVPIRMNNHGDVICYQIDRALTDEHLLISKFDGDEILIDSSDMSFPCTFNDDCQAAGWFIDNEIDDEADDDPQSEFGALWDQDGCHILQNFFPDLSLRLMGGLNNSRGEIITFDENTHTFLLITQKQDIE